MNPMRRAVVRATASASRVSSTKASMLVAVPKFAAPTVTRIFAPTAVRCFSQTFRVASEDSFSSNSTSEVTSSSNAEPGFGLFIRNMVFEANEDHLREAYEKYGEIVKVAIARDARGLSRGYGFVWFTTKEAMETAVEGTNSSFWHGRRIQVSPRTPKGSSPKINREGLGPTKSLYIGNIPYETTDAELNRIFRELENVTDVRVAVDRTTGWPRGFAHADFADTDACTAALEKLKGMTIGGRELKLDYAAEVQKPNKL